MKSSSRLDAADERRLDTLIEFLSCPSPLRPLDIFNVNLSSGVALLGLILTYMIILLQLKLGEKS